MVLGAASVADAGELMQWVLSGQEPSVEALRDGSVSGAMLVAPLAATPVLMAFWFAPVLAAWNRIGAVQSLFYSFFAVLRNWRAFVVYGGALALAGALLVVALALPAFCVPGGGQVVLSPALILILV